MHIVCLVLFLLTVLVWIYIGVSVWSTTSWAMIDNAGAFAFWHDMQTLRYVTLLQYGACAFVQLIKIFDFWKHHSVIKAGDEGGKSMQARIMMVNIVISALAFAFIVVDMCLMPRHANVGNYFFNAYFVLMVFVQIPMLHVLIVNQETKQQQMDGGKVEEWAKNDYDAALGESED